MKKRIKQILRKLSPKVNRSVEPDIYIISYPKSGRTWLRALIGRYLSLKYNLPESKILVTDFMSSRSGLPIVRFTHEASDMKNGRPYNRLSRDKQKYVHKKVILLGRDVRDTLVSAYFQATRRKSYFEGTISEFIASETLGIRKILSFYDIWLQNRHVPESFLFISYEDLHQDASSALRKVLHFIGEDAVEENLLQESIDYCSFANLKKLETENKFETSKLKPVNITDPESFKVRKGEIGGYAEYLSEEDIAFIDRATEEYRIDFSKFL